MCLNSVLLLANYFSPSCHFSLYSPSRALIPKAKSRSVGFFCVYIARNGSKSSSRHRRVDTFRPTELFFSLFLFYSTALRSLYLVVFILSFPSFSRPASKNDKQQKKKKQMEVASLLVNRQRSELVHYYTSVCLLSDSLVISSSIDLK